MIRLSVDTSFEHLGVCLTSNGMCLANYYSLCNRKNSSIIFGVIDELLKNSEIKLADIDAYVVNRGPGSYTGVRIAMGVIKTFAQVHQKPIVPVDSLELLAGQISSLKEDFPVLLNCTRRDVLNSSDQSQPVHQCVHCLSFSTKPWPFFKKSRLEIFLQ